MQKKIGTLLDENLFKKAKEKAHIQHTTLTHIFEEALSEYLSRETDSRNRPSMVETSFGTIALPLKVVHKIAQENLYET